MSLEEAAPANAESNGEHVANTIASKELAPSSFYAPERQNGNSGPAAELEAAAAEPRDGSRKRSRRDSDFSEIEEEDAGSDFYAGDSADSDDSFLRLSRRKQKAEEAQQKRFRPPEDTEMRQKLRGSTLQATLSATEDESRPPSQSRDHPSETESLSDQESDPTAVPSRDVPVRVEQEQKEMLKTSWELIAILDFLSIFQPYLGLEQLNFSAEELESCLVLNNGTSGLLPELHIGVMRGISTRTKLHSGNWTASLAEKLKLYWRAGQLSGVPPFKPQRRWEAVEYAKLPLENRVTALRILCELRLDKDDLHNVVEYALHPPRKTKAEKKAEALAAQTRGRRQPVEPPDPTMEQMRKQPLAKDSSGLLYWYLDYHTTSGTRLYREVPSSLWKSKSKKEQAGPQWELLGTSPEEMTELGEKLRRSKKKPDQSLASAILDEIVPELLERREAEFRKQKAAAKRQAQLSNIIPSGRSRRARKEVNYSFDAYDATIRAALRQGSEEPEAGRATRSSRFDEPRMTAEEEAQLGLRRGRSARAASPPLDLPPTRRVQRNETPEVAEFEPSSETGPGSSEDLDPSLPLTISSPETREPSMEQQLSTMPAQCLPGSSTDGISASASLEGGSYGMLAQESTRPVSSKPDSNATFKVQDPGRPISNATDATMDEPRLTYAQYRLTEY